MSDAQDTPLGTTARPPDEFEVQSLEFLATEYDFTAPDLFVGPDSSQYLLDYGQPVILADSRGGDPFRIRAEASVWTPIPGLSGEHRPRTSRLRRLWRWASGAPA